MHAYLLDQPDHALSAEVLRSEGILYWQLPVDPSEYAGPVANICQDRGYVQMDEIFLGENTPDLEALCAKFFVEHLHTDEEIRFVVAGSGIFDLRDVHDRWMRVHVVPGDLIIVPAQKYHRFTLDAQQTITCKRLFQDTRGWVAEPRAGQ